MVYDMLGLSFLIKYLYSCYSLIYIYSLINFDPLTFDSFKTADAAIIKIETYFSLFI